MAGMLAAVALGLGFGDPAPLLDRDASLAHLLRGMAAIKAVLVVAAAAVVAWRLRWPAAPAVAIAYGVGVCAMAAATALIWQLSFIAGAALLFHVAEIGLLLLAWRDGLWQRARANAR